MNSIRHMLIRWRLPLLAAAAAIAAAGAASAITIALVGADEAPAGAGEPTASEPPPAVVISVVAETDSGLVGQNHDDELCVWRELQYELRDAAGVVIDVGRQNQSGVSAGDAEWASTGEIRSADPYHCVTA